MTVKEAFEIRTTDPEALIKYCVREATRPIMLATFERVLSESGDLASIGGDPGWDIERRRPGLEPQTRWPEHAFALCWVDERIMSVGASEAFVTRERLEAIVHDALSARDSWGSFRDQVERIRALLKPRETARAAVA